MGCECLKPEEMTKEIKTYNTEDKDNYIILKNEKIKDMDTYINSIKTSDKNTFNANKNTEIFSSSKNNNNKFFFGSEKINENINTSKNITNDEKTMDNNNINININVNNQMNINKRIKKNQINIVNKKKIIKNSNKILVDKIKPKGKDKILKIKKIKEELPSDDFSKYIFEHINKIRTDPQSFIKNIEEAKAYIVRNQNNKLIYKKNVKVSLSQGLLAFEEAISILKFSKPMDKLIFGPKLTVKLPTTEEDILDKKYFKNEIKKMLQKGVPIQAYWRDIIKNPETSFLMMIVDDTGLKAGLKRKDILDPNMKYIGICSTTIGKHFVCFMTFSY